MRIQTAMALGPLCIPLCVSGRTPCQRHWKHWHWVHTDVLLPECLAGRAGPHIGCVGRGCLPGRALDCQGRIPPRIELEPWPASMDY